MSATPSISVVMPVYNGMRYLRQAIASIRWQTFSDWELLCINDGSTDGSLEILQQFAALDTRIQVLDQDNQGIVEALNHGVRAARGDWIARMDCDDIAIPERFAVQHQFVNEHSEVVALGSNVLSVDSEGMPLFVDRYETEHTAIEQCLLTGSGGSLAHPSVLMRREAVLEAGMYRKKFEWVEDLDLWLRLSERGQLANIPSVLLHYRLHDQSVCWNRRELQHERLQLLHREAHQIRGLPLPHCSRTKKRLRKQTSAAGKWARRAARAGYFRSAMKHWRRQVSEEPLSLFTLRVTAEAILRGTMAMLSIRPGPTKSLPDWREWDLTAPQPIDQKRTAA